MEVAVLVGSERAEQSTIDTFEIASPKLELLMDYFAERMVDELIGVGWMSGVEMQTFMRKGVLGVGWSVGDVIQGTFCEWFCMLLS